MSDRIKLAYEEFGSGRPVVLLHGFCGDRGYWTTLKELLGTRYRCIIPDLRGHGRSEAPDTPYTVEGMADDVASLMETLELEKPVLLGHSLGGYVALAFAEAHADRLSGFGLIHSTAYPDTDQAKENRNKAIAAIQEKGIRPFIDGLIPKLFAPEHLEPMAEQMQIAKEIGYATPPQGAMHTAEAMRDRADRNHVLQASSLPVLLVAGAKDQIIPVEKTFSVQAAHITQARIEQAGHMSMMEAPAELAAVLNDYLQKTLG